MTVGVELLRQDMGEEEIQRSESGVEDPFVLTEFPGKKRLGEHNPSLRSSKRVTLGDRH